MSPNWCAGWMPRWPASPGKRSSSTTIRPTAPPQAVKDIAAGDSRVRCLRRVGRRGLAGACIEGMLSSAAPFVAVMDADLQHDEKVLPADAGAAARRRRRSGGRHPLCRRRQRRKFFARAAAPFRALATRLTHRLVGTKLSDPMSGFFMMRRDRFEEIAPRLSPVGFKILLDIAATGGERLAHRRTALCLRRALRRRKQIQRPDRGRISGPAAGQDDRRSGRSALHLFRHCRHAWAWWCIWWR